MIIIDKMIKDAEQGRQNVAGSYVRDLARVNIGQDPH